MMLKNTDNHGQRTQDSDAISQISCRRIGDLLAATDLSSIQRHQDSRQYFLVEQGGGVAVVDDQEFSLVPGSFLVIPPNALYRLMLEPGTDGFSFVGPELFMRTRVAQALFTTSASFWESYYRPSVHQDITGLNNAGKRRQLFAEVAAAVQRLGLGCDAAVMGYIFVLITEDTIPDKIAGEPHSKPESSDSHLLYRFQLLLERHYLKHYPIEDYCRMLGVTRIKLIEVCKQVSKLTPLELIHSRLVMEAKRELLNTSKTINQIALDLGFADSAYFSRFFKKQTGVSPIHFRHPEESKGKLPGPARTLGLIACWAPCLAYETQQWIYLV